MRRYIVIAAGMLLVIVLMAGSIVVEANPAAGLEGTWLVHVAPVGAPPYMAIASFTDEGIMIVTPDPVSPTESTATGQGVWRKGSPSGGRPLSSTHASFAYAAPGVIAFSYRINAQYRLTSKDSFVGSAQLEMCAGGSFDNCVLQPGVTELAGARIR